LSIIKVFSKKKSSKIETNLGAMSALGLVSIGALQLLLLLKPDMLIEWSTDLKTLVSRIFALQLSALKILSKSASFREFSLLVAVMSCFSVWKWVESNTKRCRMPLETSKYLVDLRTERHARAQLRKEQFAVKHRCVICCPQDEHRDKKFRIIAFEGGGIRGLYSTVVIGRILKHFPSLLEQADLLCGTSTGAFIAICVGMGYSAEEVRKCIYARVICLG
jgi:predicted nucleic acid binding AN1-type Zn finger protein